MRTSPRRDCGSIDRSDLPDGPGEAPIGADRSDLRRHADADERQILLRQLRLHFHLAALGEAEQGAASRG